MLFDPNFLTFMRDLLVMTAGTSKEGLGFQCKKDNKSGMVGKDENVTSSAGTNENGGAPSLSADSSTADTIVASAYEFFASIVVKAKDKTDV
jgi:hypothetical protein